MRNILFIKAVLIIALLSNSRAWCPIEEGAFRKEARPETPDLFAKKPEYPAPKPAPKISTEPQSPEQQAKVSQEPTIEHKTAIIEHRQLPHMQQTTVIDLPKGQQAVSSPKEASLLESTTNAVRAVGEAFKPLQEGESLAAPKAAEASKTEVNPDESNLSFEVAEKHLNTPKLLDTEDTPLSKEDKEAAEKAEDERAVRIKSMATTEANKSIEEFKEAMQKESAQKVAINEESKPAETKTEAPIKKVEALTDEEVNKYLSSHNQLEGFQDTSAELDQRFKNNTSENELTETKNLINGIVEINKNKEFGTGEIPDLVKKSEKFLDIRVKTIILENLDKTKAFSPEEMSELKNMQTSQEILERVKLRNPKLSENLTRKTNFLLSTMKSMVAIGLDISNQKKIVDNIPGKEALVKQKEERAAKKKAQKIETQKILNNLDPKTIDKLSQMVSPDKMINLGELTPDETTNIIKIGDKLLDLDEKIYNDMSPEEKSQIFNLVKIRARQLQMGDSQAAVTKEKGGLGEINAPNDLLKGKYGFVAEKQKPRLEKANAIFKNLEDEVTLHKTKLFLTALVKKTFLSAKQKKELERQSQLFCDAFIKLYNKTPQDQQAALITTSKPILQKIAKSFLKAQKTNAAQAKKDMKGATDEDIRTVYATQEKEALGKIAIIKSTLK